MTSRSLMVQGTTSDAGKSTLAAGLCRILFQQGCKVAPFKPQNMALNSAVTVDGGEIGRAQAAQALACGLEPHTDMNPVLLKPNTDIGAQVIVNGRARATMDAVAYHAYKPALLADVLAAYQRLRARFDHVVIEGAGSPAEINLREHDIANMGFAEAADCPVVLVADIDRGGVFAHLTGTLELLRENERARVGGFVINRFRGDVALLKPGLDWLEQRTGIPVLGVLPWLPGLLIEAEDALPARSRNKPAGAVFRVVIPRLPRLSNHTDFDPLMLNPGIEVCFVREGEDIPPADLIILPGSKSVRNDLAWLRKTGWEQTLRRHLRYGGKVLGICGGYQMLGREIHDPLGLEGAPGSSPGLGWLDMATELMPEKQLCRVSGSLCADGAPLVGYEIHAGISHGPALSRPVAMLADKPDGAVSDDGQVLGTYVHGIFDTPQASRSLLAWAGVCEPVALDMQALRLAGLDSLAAAMRDHLDIEGMLSLFR